jgi:hypothetical protein
LGEAKGPEMFRDLTVGELQMLFAVLGERAFAGRRRYVIWSEIGEVQEDVNRALADAVHAESARRWARYDARPRDPELEDEAELF